MDNKAKPAALVLGVLAAGAMAAPAMAEEAVRTRPAMTTEQMIAAQQQQIESQQAQIEALREQLQDVTATLSNRVDRVETQTEAGRVNFANPSARLESPNSRNTLQFVGALQATFGDVTQNTDEDGDGNQSAQQLHGGTEIKRARIGLQGTAFSDYAYAVEFDLAQLPGTSASVAAAARDLWVQYNGFRPFSLTIGNMKPQVGLEASFSDRSNAATFAEPSLATSLITTLGTRFVGLRAGTGGDHWSAALGVYGDDVNNNGNANPYEEGGGFAGRISYAPIVSAANVLHFGVSGYSREVGTITATESATTPAEQGRLQPRATPESTIDASTSSRLIDAGNLNFASSVQLLALEAAGFHGPFGFQAEWAQMDVSQDRTAQGRGRPDLTFTGAYAQANWFVTGESRAYDGRTGLFTRVTPRASLDPQGGTWGTFEIAARWSTLDLNSEENTFATAPNTVLGVRGGEETNYTVGLNWYWNAYFRLMLNYVHADVERLGTHNFTTGADQRLDNSADLFSVRVQQEW